MSVLGLEKGRESPSETNSPFAALFRGLALLGPVAGAVSHKRLSRRGVDEARSKRRAGAVLLWCGASMLAGSTAPLIV